MSISFLVRHRNAISISVLMVLSLLLWLPRLRGPLDLRFDAGVYYILGTSLWEGKGYRLLNEPGAIQAIQYPPLLPLFAAVHQRLAGTSDPAIAGHMLRVSFFVIFLAFIVAVYRLSSHYLTPGLAFLATLLVLLHVHTTWMSEVFFAELPFALLSVLFLLAARSKERSREWLVGVLAVLCFLLRSTGIAVLGAWVGESLLKRRFREMALRTIVALVPILGWHGYIAHVKHGPEYAQPAYQYQRASYQFYNVGYLENLTYVDTFAPELGRESLKGLLGRVVRNLKSMPENLGGAVSVRAEWVTFWLERLSKRVGTLWKPLTLANVVPFLVLDTMVLIGLVLLTIRAELLIALYVAGSCVLTCLTPWPAQYARYLWPLTPLLAIALFTTLVMVGDHFSTVSQGRLRTVVIAIFAGGVIGVFSTECLALHEIYRLRDTAFYRAASGQQHEYSLLFYTPDWQDHDKVLDWLRGHSNPHDIVATSTPHWVYLKTGLQSVMPPFEPNVNEAQRLLDSVPVRYLIVDSLGFMNVGRRYTTSVVETFPERWELIYSSGNKGSMIYRRRTEEKME